MLPTQTPTGFNEDEGLNDDVGEHNDDAVWLKGSLNSISLLTSVSFEPIWTLSLSFIDYLKKYYVCLSLKQLSGKAQHFVFISW